MAGFEYRQAEEVRAAFERHGCRYLFTQIRVGNPHNSGFSHCRMGV